MRICHLVTGPDGTTLVTTYATVGQVKESQKSATASDSYNLDQLWLWPSWGKPFRMNIDST